MVNTVTAPVTTYADTGLNSGTTYWYKITAYDNGNNESAKTGAVSATPVDLPPAAPVGLSASPGSKQISLSWTANIESDVTGYMIYRSASQNGTYTMINTVNAPTTTYTNTGLSDGTTYWYKIKAYDAGSNESLLSAAVSATTSTIPAAPRNVEADDGPSQNAITISWSANTEPEVAYYDIYRSTSQNGTYNLIKTVSKNENKTSYQDGNLNDDNTYWYYIIARTSTNVKSNPSSKVSQEPK